MNKHRSLLRFAILVLLGGLCLCAFTPGLPQAGSPLIFVADQAYAPITYLENGVPQGVYVDITQALGQALNRKIEIRLMDWAVAQQQVLDGTADAISGMSISEQRQQLYDFSDVILTFEYSLFVRSDSPSLRSLNDYKGKKVGVTPGGYPRQLVEAIPEIQVVLVDTYQAGFQLLQEGKIEALAADKWAASYLITQNHLEGVVLIDPPFAIQESAFAVKKGNQALLDEINQGLQVLQQQGEIDRIKSQWATTEVVFFTQRELTQYLLLTGLAVMAVLLIGLLGWVASLRKNIAQRRRVEAQLREAEAKYRTLIEKLPAITYLAILGEADQINQITYMSPQIETLLGFPPEAWTQDPNFWPTRIHPADRERVLAASQVRDPAHMPRDLTYRALTREGRVLWFQSHTSFLFDDEGRPRYAQGILLDITDRKRAEEALHESEARYRAVVENQTEFIVRWKADGLRTFVNEAYCRHFGVTLEQALATSFLSHVAEDDRRAIEEKIARLNSGQVDMEIEVHRVINPDGSLGWQEWIDQAIRDEAGNLIEFQSVGRDVTARKQAEAALERYTSRLEILHEIDRAILAVHSPEETALAALTRLRRLIPGVRAGVMLWDEQANELTLLATLATGPSAYTTSGMRFPVVEIPDVIEALRQGEPIIIEDVRALPRPFYIYNLLLEEGVRSWLHAPLMYQGTLIGALNFGAAESGTFHAEHIEIAREVANQLVIALENAQLFALKQRSLSRMEILHEIDQAILTAQSPQATAQAALDKMRPLIGCLRASISLFDFQANEEWLLAVSTQLPVRFPPNTRTPLEQFGPGIIDRLQHQQPFVIEDVSDWPGLSPAQQQLAADGIQSWLYTPLVYQGELIGSLNLGDTQANPFGLERIEVAREVADQIAIAVQQARLFEQVTATRDQLQALSHRLVDAQEAERRHIARELHDEIGQSLTGLKLALQMILRLSPEMIPARVSDALKVINDLMAQVHDLSLDLRPMMLDDLGLVSALLWLFEHYTAQTGVQVYSEFLRLENRLPPQVETTAYRIVQEALTNVARHSGAKEVWVRLLVEDSQLRLQVQDTGVGFNVPAALSAGERLGVAGMQERAALLGGWLQVDSQPGLGTQVTALLPFRHTEGP